jgi:hypothetical protein
LLHDSARGSFGSGDGVILKLEEVLQWLSPSLAWFRLEPIHPLNAKQSGWVGSGWMALTATERPSRPTRNFTLGNAPSTAPKLAPRRIQSTKKDPQSQRSFCSSSVPSGWSQRLNWSCPARLTLWPISCSRHAIFSSWFRCTGISMASSPTVKREIGRNDEMTTLEVKHSGWHPLLSN